MGLPGMLFALLVGIGLTIGAVSLYNQVTSRMAEQGSIELLNTMRANVHSVYSGQSSYGTAESLIDTLDKFGRIPDSARKAGPPVTMEHTFGYPVSIWGNGGRYAITFHKLDDAVCTNIAKAYAGRSRARSGIVLILVSATAPVAATAVSAAAPAERNLTWVTTNCNEGAEANYLTFVFG